MKQINILLLVLLITGIQFSPSMNFRPASSAITIDGKLNCPFISEHGGTVYLQISVNTVSTKATVQRKPLNLAIVLDRSGSMGDQSKIEFAKKAFYQLVDQLLPSDILSIVVYDDVIDIIRKARRVDGDKKEIRRLLDEIYPRNSTNLGGGLVEGLKQAERFADKEYINRVVLLSDGLANVGITDPHELNKIARRYRSKSISVTTMGVGLDYNENLMMGLSESGGGNYYFIENPNGLASIVRKEFDLMSSIIAQNCSIKLSLGKNVTVNDIIGCEFQNENITYTIPVGDLYANDHREFTVKLSIPEGKGAMTVANGELLSESETIKDACLTFSSSVKYTHDVAVIEKNRDMEIQAKADVAVSTRSVQKAMEAMDQGDNKVAEQSLQEAREIMSSSPAMNASGGAGATMQSQLSKVESYSRTLKEENDSRKAKKSIQYDNYRTQKSK